MTDHKIDLALAFLQSQPAAAAAILEQQPIEQVAEFLNHVPYTHAAPVLAKMLPQYAARLCKILQPTVSAALLSDMELSLVASIVRYCSLELGKQLLGLLPDKTRIACRLLLNYSEEAVGAWMTVNVLGIPDDYNVEEALSLVRSERHLADTAAAYVVDRDGHLKGVLSLGNLISAAANTSVTVVMDKNRESISARTALISAISNPAWVHRDTLPVTNRSQQLIGVLRYVDLRKGLDQISTTIVQSPGSGPITGIVEAYGKSLLTLFNTVTDLVQTKKTQR